MISQFLSKRLSYLLMLIFIFLNSILIYFDFYYLLALPLVIIIGFLYIFHLDIIFLIIVFCTPLSFNFENLDIGGIGFYFPTEPMLLIFSGLFIFNSIYQKKYFKDFHFYKNPIVLLIITQLIWIFTSSITSEIPVVSLKFLISRTWFIIPLIFYGFHFFKSSLNFYHSRRNGVGANIIKWATHCFRGNFKHE